jgi:hypothetical protein
VSCSPSRGSPASPDDTVDRLQNKVGLMDGARQDQVVSVSRFGPGGREGGVWCRRWQTPYGQQPAWNAVRRRSAERVTAPRLFVRSTRIAHGVLGVRLSTDRCVMLPKPVGFASDWPQAAAIRVLSTAAGSSSRLSNLGSYTRTPGQPRYRRIWRGRCVPACNEPRCQDLPLASHLWSNLPARGGSRRSSRAARHESMTHCHLFAA